MTAHILIGISKSKYIAIAAPNISAIEVATEANIAVVKNPLLIQGLRCLVVASDKHKPVAIPKCATLCCSKISILVESVIDWVVQ